MTSPTRREAIQTGAALAVASTFPADAHATQPAARVPEGYPDQLSYAPGDEVKLHISATRCDLELFRVGAERKSVWKQVGVDTKVHEVPKNASSHGCDWPVAASFKIPADWPSGYYECRISTQPPGQKEAVGTLFFVVRPKEPGKNAKILLQLATNTYNAYTNWGGYSLYAYHGRHKVQGRRVSFHRPQSSLFGRWEEPFVKWAEKAGYALDFATNLDLEARPDLLKGYKLVLSVGHDEYWSSPMRDALEKYIGKGGNVAFFSGNTCCWQVRTEDDGRAL
ncbi:MAG: hypothetical protein K2V38_26855, partial [Gemmataceae bacterium]|nr:hypothetical protein [Gemmataceae bacterium]